MKRVEKFEGVLNGTTYNDKSAFVKALGQFKEDGKEITEIHYGTTVTYEEDDDILPNEQPVATCNGNDCMEYLFPDCSSINKAFDAIRKGTAEDSDKVIDNIEKNMSDRLRFLVNNSLLVGTHAACIKDTAAEAAKRGYSDVESYASIRANIINDIEGLKSELHKIENCIKFASDFAGYAECIGEYVENICK